MKQFIIVLSFLFLLFPIELFSQEEPTMCPMDMSQFPQDSIPNYLQPWWNNVRTGYFAVIFVDFPDGRWNDNGELKQPFTNEQLAMVPVLDAAGEMGLVLEPTNIQAGNKYVKAAKYTWKDRWNMFFDSLGVYYGSAHPDFVSNEDSAYGSFKQYWKEASNGKFELIPYLTHPNESDYKLRTGIVNNYEIINGDTIIKCFQLPKKKYGLNNNDSYFRDPNDQSDLNGVAERMSRDVITILTTQTNFDTASFKAAGGKLFVYFAGTHNKFKDVAYFRWISPIRLREDSITNPKSRIDGFGVSAHQYGHLEFGWAHTNTGRCDIMNGGDVHDNNCPQLPNPIYRTQLGWLQPISLDSSQLVSDLNPVETSYQCGVITIYGKPTASPDWSTGEYYVVENRRRLGFDRRIVELGILNQSFPNFKGGLLIWHYSPYYDIFNPSFAPEQRIQLKHNDTTTNLTGSSGNPKVFFAWDQFTSSQFYNLDSSKTRSGSDLQTGIDISDIAQLDYGSLNSDIEFNLNYLISDPTRYEDVIFWRNNYPYVKNYSGKVFYHEFDPEGYFGFNSGSTIEHPGTNNGSNSTFNFNTIEANGIEILPIKFTGVGYTSEKTKIPGLIFRNLSTNLNIDSLILNNIQIENLKASAIALNIGYISESINQIPVDLKHIEIEENNAQTEIFITNSTISKIQLDGVKITINKKNNFNGDLYLENGNLKFTNSNCLFQTNMGINTTNTIINATSGSKDTFTVQAGNTNWKGFELNGGSINLQNSIIENAHTGIALNGGSMNLKSSIIRNALIGIEVNEAIGDIFIRDNNFINNQDYDISIYKPNFGSGEIPIISKNTFIQNNESSAKTASIFVSECPYLNIDTNTFINSGFSGIILMNCESPVLNNNSISSVNIQGNLLFGILSYNSNGYYKCNRISQCSNYGILLDNSQPVIFNNEIFVNGIGLYLTNNSNPVMMPGYLNNETYVLGGYNYFHQNAGEEIYCNNSKFNSSIPIIYKGYNAIVDSIPILNDILIKNTEVFGIAPNIDCPQNYWGGDSPSGRLIPDYSFKYDDYLTTRLEYACEFISEPANNETESEEYLLFGNLLKNQQQENYEAALDYSNQMLSLQNSEINPVIPLNNIFTSTLFSNGNFADLENYYLSRITQNPNTNFDTILNNKLLNLSLETKIAANEIEPAISEYDNIINSNQDEEVRFYASIDRSRAIRLLLDSLLSYYSGDNPGQNINQLYSDAINYQSPSSNNKKSEKSESKKNNDVKDGNKELNVKSNAVNSFAFLKKSIDEKIKNFDNLDQREKRNLIMEKNILDLAVNNYVEGIASIKDKLQLLNQQTTEIPKTYKLYQNYPNPFNPTTTIKLEIPNSGIVKLRIFDLLGREVMALVNEFKDAGSYEAVFNGSTFSSGIYFYKLEAGDFKQVKRMVLVK